MKKHYSFLLTGLLAAGFLASPNESDAQAVSFIGTRFKVNTPTGVQGFKNVNVTNDGNANTANNWGRAIDSVWLNVPLVAADDYLSCATLNNGTGTVPSLANSFALISRGNCTFLEKAYFAVQAGAIGVVIVNNTDGMIGMTADMTDSRVAQLSRIPILSVSQLDGNALKAVLDLSQTVTVSLSNWGFGNTNDLTLLNKRSAFFHAFAIPQNQLTGSTDAPYRIYNSAIVANTGSASATSVKVKQEVSFTPASTSTATVLVRDSVTIASLSVGDSLNILNSTNSNFLNVSSEGIANFKYTVSSSIADDDLNDNVDEFNVHVTKGVFSKGRWDAVKQEPMSDGGYKLSGTSELLWGSLFYVAKNEVVEAGVTKDILAEKMQFAVSMGTTDDPDGLLLQGHSPIMVALFEWNDLNSNGNFDVNELNIVALGDKRFTTADSAMKFFHVDLQDAANSGSMYKLKAQTWYWAAVDLGNDLFINCDLNGKQSYNTRMYASEKSNGLAGREYYAPMYDGNSTLSNGTEFRQFPFYTPIINTYSMDSLLNFSTYIPSIAFHTIADVTNLNETAKEANTLQLYPNPVKDRLVVNIKSELANNEDVSYTLLDGVGRIINRGSARLSNGQFEVNTANLSSGQYFIMLRAGKGESAVISASKFMVK